MKKLNLLLIVVTLLSIGACTPKIDIEDEKAEIQKVIDEYLDAVDSLDVNRILAVLTEDHLALNSNGPRFVGKQAYKGYFTSWIIFSKDLKHKEMSFEKDEIVVSGDWAFQIGTYFTKFIRQDNSILEYEGNYVWLFKKDNEGYWKWSRTISNTTKPPLFQK